MQSSHIRARDPVTGASLAVTTDATLVWSSGAEWRGITAELHRFAGLDTPEFTVSEHLIVIQRTGATPVELVVPVRIDGRGKTPQGTVFVPFFDEMKLVNRLTLDAMDNISYEPDYKKCAVRVEKI